MKEIKGFPGYFVTKNGKVYSNKRGKLRELKPAPRSKNGYLGVALTKNGKKVTKNVHRLVAEAYIPNPDNLPEVNHIDENKLNNHVDNLEWVTSSQNTRYSAYKQAKFYIIENKNRERFEVFGLRQWCRESKVNRGNLNATYKSKTKWAKGYRIVSIRDLTLEESRSLRGSHSW